MISRTKVLATLEAQIEQTFPARVCSTKLMPGSFELVVRIQLARLQNEFEGKPDGFTDMKL